MLILTRNKGESIIINSDIKVTILDVSKRRIDQVKVGIEAPKEITINRQEVQERIDMETHDYRPNHQPLTNYENKHGE